MYLKWNAKLARATVPMLLLVAAMSNKWVTKIDICLFAKKEKKSWRHSSYLLSKNGIPSGCAINSYFCNLNIALLAREYSMHNIFLFIFAMTFTAHKTMSHVWNTSNMMHKSSLCIPCAISLIMHPSPFCLNAYCYPPMISRRPA